MNRQKANTHRCCFTGHRPGKLGKTEHEIKTLLETAIDRAIARGYTTFLTGMAEGTDIWAAEIILEKKQKNPALHLICAIPHPDFEKYRSVTEKERYNRIKNLADYVTIISPHYYKACYQKRNQFMVDHASLVIAVWNGSPSGTANTLRYARQKSVEIINVLEPSFLR